MNVWKRIILPLTLLFLCCLSVQARPPVVVKITKGEAKVNLLKGEAAIVCPDDQVTRGLKVNDSVKVGCEVSIGTSGRIELVLPDKSIIRFAEKSKFKFARIDQQAHEGQSVELAMSVGKVWSNVRKSIPGKESKFEVSCPNAVAGVRGTIYRVDVESDSSAVVKVYDGEVRVAGLPRTQQQNVAPIGPPKPVAGPTTIEGPKPVSMEQWVYIVKSMQKIYIDAKGKAREPESFQEPEDVDDWTKWNKRRDRKNRQ